MTASGRKQPVSHQQRFGEKLSAFLTLIGYMVAGFGLICMVIGGTLVSPNVRFFKSETKHVTWHALAPYILVFGMGMFFLGKWLI